MAIFRPEDLAAWLGVPWSGGLPASMIQGISTDTRTLRPGELYVALRGEQFDGHRFVAEAFKAGAAGALVDRSFAGEMGPVLRVDDTLAGLQQLARGYRATWSARVVGITGSVGKTTVKEMCADLLSSRWMTHRTAGNFNNHIGLPLTMLRMPPEAEMGVFEIGMNHPGEIRPLAALLRPDVVVMTDVANAHIEHFESEQGIAEEKAELPASLGSNGWAVLALDGRWFELLRSRCAGRVVTVALGAGADYCGEMTGPDLLRVGETVYTLPLPGEHTHRNALRAITLGLELGLSPSQIQAGLNRFKAPAMRWEKEVAGGVEFINDAYNASPLSMRAALSTFAELPCEGRKVAVLGGMRELGDRSEEEHRALGCFLEPLSIDEVVCVGPLAAYIAGAMGRSVRKAGTLEEASQWLTQWVLPGDQVLLKGSRGERLEGVLASYKNREFGV
jgi:UDP-N-acetylmuramoyl-tripeptide--D-alanyl-D-alanine ligase